MPKSTAERSWGTSSCGSALRPFPALHRRWRGLLLCGVSGRRSDDRWPQHLDRRRWRRHRLCVAADRRRRLLLHRQIRSAFLEYKFLNYEEAGTSGRGRRSPAPRRRSDCAGTSKRSNSLLVESRPLAREAGFFCVQRHRTLAVSNRRGRLIRCAHVHRAPRQNSPPAFRAPVRRCSGCGNIARRGARSSSRSAICSAR